MEGTAGGPSETMHLELSTGQLVEVEGDLRGDPAEVEHQVAARAGRLAAAGLDRGDRVILGFGNRAPFFAELLAVWRQGGCAIPIDPRLTPFEVRTLAGAARARYAVVDEGTDPGITAELTGACERVFSADEADRHERALAGPGAHLDDDALILFTSGTTGDPKGVVHTHRSLLARWSALRENLGIEAYRRTLCLLPTHFGHGLICNCLFPWLSGADLHIARPFRPELLMRLGPVIDEHEITFLSSVPSVWRLALKVGKRPEKGTLARVHVGSAPLTAHLWEGVREWSGTDEVFNAYGITETGSWVAGTTIPGFAPEDGLIGRPWGAVVKVLRTSSTAEPLTADDECAPNETGHVWLRTPALMRGYFERDDLTRAVVRDGWFWTGDIGVLDREGRLFLRGREREEINKGGAKIQPADVDAVVERFQGAKDACTFAVEDAAYGQDVGLAVVLEDAGEETLRGLHAWLKEHLAEHKLPVRWWVLEEIPRTSRGKINRESVARACADVEPVDLVALLRGT